MTIAFDTKCSYLNGTNTYSNRVLTYCKTIVPYVRFYKRQIAYYNKTASNILENEIGLILPNFLTDKRPKRGVILASVLEGMASRIIGLAYKGISSFLHHKRHQTLHKAIKVMEKKTDLQGKKVHHLEDTMIMYSAYNSDTFTDLLDTVYRMHNISTWKEKTFSGNFNRLIKVYKQQDGVQCYATNLVFFLTTVREKYIKCMKDS